MERRAGRVLHRALGLRATQAPPRFPWAGTFHSVGARLLREYAHRIGLAPNFTILDRADAEDLMGLQRQALGLARDHRPLSAEGDLPEHLLARRQQRGAAGPGAAGALPLVLRGP